MTANTKEVEKKPVGLYKQFKTDKNLEKDGIILDYGEAGRIRIARAGGNNERFKRYTEAQLKPYTRQISAGTMDEKLATKISADIYAKTIILGWEEVTGEDGKPLEFTVENVTKVLLDLPDLFSDIQKAASDATLFRADVQDAVAGN